MMWLIPLALVGLYLLYRGFFLEPDALRLERVSVQVGGAVDADVGGSDDAGDAGGGRTVRGACDGARILHVTDLHLRNEPEYESRLLQLARKAKPHLIALTGDYVDEKNLLGVLERVVSGLCQICPVYAVLGDNDLEKKRLLPEEIQEAMERAGAHVMRNEGVVVAAEPYKLFLCGIDDPREASANLPSALLERPADVVAVLLSHSAEIHQAAEAAGVDLMLCGHTHGGQVRVPGYGAPYTNDRLGRRFAAGMIERGRLRIHVGRGVGWAKMKVRLFCPPEVTVLTLRR